MKNQGTSPLKIFISYSHDSPEHSDWVANFANQLRNPGGVEANIDQFVAGAFPEEDWDTWMFRQIREADFVLCICTETYKRRAEGDEEPGKGLGVKWEGNIIRKRIYDEIENNKKKFVAVLPPNGNKAHKPYFLPIHYFEMPGAWDNLFRLFFNLPQVEPEVVSGNAYIPKTIKTSPSSASDSPEHLAGRAAEMQQLTDFWNNPAKPIFTFYGVAQMGKSFTIQRWSETQLKDFETVRVTLTEGLIPSAIAGELIFGNPELPETHRLAQAIAARFQNKTLVWFENMELALELKPGQDSHRLQDQALHEILKKLSANSHVKIILESRHFIDLPEINHLTVALRENQLQKIATDYFWPFYQGKFTRPELNLIYQKTGGNTWLLLNIPSTFDDLFEDKEAFLENLRQSASFEKYREDYLRSLLDRLDETQVELICRLVFSYQPRAFQEILPDGIQVAEFKDEMQSLHRTLLIVADADKRFAINGYVREVCRLHFKDRPAMQRALKEQEQKVGKKFRADESAENRIDRYTYLIRENTGFIPYYVELSKAYNSKGKNSQAQKVLSNAFPYAFTYKNKIILYTELISISDYATALKWFEEMSTKGLTPNEISYSTLVNKSPDYATALKWFEEMSTKGLTPNEISYSTLVNKSPDYATALK
ncbi:MAG: TIR domain-containing protein, partial [Saprospiraceae bacterium]|nr:TIR domain-containing protein [Saprospiraceae bacterium]